MNRKLIVVLLAAVGLTAGVAVAEPTGVASRAADLRKPAATPSAMDSTRPLKVAGTPLSGAAEQARLNSPADGGSVQPESQPARVRGNNPHPAVLSHSHPVYPVGVPLPPVSLERY